MATRRWHQCQEKVPYATREEAEAVRRSAPSGRDKEVYRCGWCANYHIGFNRRRRLCRKGVA